MPLLALVEVVHGNLDRLEGPCGRVEGLLRQLRRVEDLLAEAAARPLIFRAVRRERGQEQRLQAFGEGQ